MTDEHAIIKLGLKTGAGSSHGKSVQATIRFVIQPVIFFIPFMTLDRLASERTSSLSIFIIIAILLYLFILYLLC